LKPVDLVITDPPYGIGRDKGFPEHKGFKGKIVRTNQYNDNWDKKRPSQKIFNLILEKSHLTLIFGGNFFADLLPQSTHWIVWDKKNTMPSYGDAELIWTNSKRKSVKIIEYGYNGLKGMERIRYHPTQKPVKLLIKLIKLYSNQKETILDPYLGSGTTAVACERLGIKWIGIEIMKKYCDIAVKRIERQTKIKRQKRIF